MSVRCLHTVDDTRGHSQVQEQVQRHADLIVHRHPQEDMQLLVDRALVPPLDDRVKDQLTTPYNDKDRTAMTAMTSTNDDAP